MKMKKVVACLFVIILTTGMLVGCSKEELAFYNLSNDLTTLKYTKPVQSEGTINLQLDVLPESVTEYDEDDAESVMKTIDFIKDNSLVYTIKSDVANNKVEAIFDLKNEKTGEKVPLMAVLRNEDTTYVKVDDYINIIKQLITTSTTEEEKKEFNLEMDRIFGDMQYMSISDDEMIVFFKQMMESSTYSATAGVMAPTYDQLIEESLDSKYALEKQEINNQLVKQLLEKVYDDYTLDIVKQDKNKYTATLDANNLGNTLFGFLDYSLEHSDELGNTIKEYIKSLTLEQYSMLVGAYAVSSINQEMMAQQIDEAMKDVNENKLEYKASIEQGLAMYESMFKQYIDGSIMQIAIGKETDGTYTSDFLLKVKVNDPLTKKVEFEGSLICNATVKEIATFTVQEPTQNVTSFTQFLKQFPKVLTVEVSYGYYNMTNFEKGMMGNGGEISVVNIAGYNYLPLRKIAEMFGEEVEWDNVNKQVYIVKDGVRIKMDNVVIQNSTAYIKAREFEKLGYVIEWENMSEMITITKN